MEQVRDTHHIHSQKAGQVAIHCGGGHLQRHTFLSLEDDSGPSIAVPVKEIERDLDAKPKVLPPYVFFEVSATVFQQETKQPYPFRYSSR